jgi:subtilisin family serine protease
MRWIGRARLAIVLVAAGGLLGLTGCEPKKPVYICDTGAASAPQATATPPRNDPLAVEEAGEEAKAAVAEAEVRTLEDAVPLVTVEQGAAGPEIVSTPVGNEAEAEAVAEAAAADGDLVAVEPDSVVTADAIPDDPLFTNGSQYALAQVGFSATWDDGFDGPESGAGQTVAVVDTGVDQNHPDLGATRVRDGMTFGDYGPATDDTSDIGHGTRVAGIIAAATNNTTGVAGAAPAAQILPVRVLDNLGRGFAADVAEGVLWAVDNNATVINLSLGGSSSSDAMHLAVHYAVQHNVPVISSSGNNGRCGAPSYPAAFPEVLAVGATGPDGQWASFSTTGPHVDLAAPGEQIWSTFNNNDYNSTSGTSFSAPYVAAAAAIVRARHPEFGAIDVFVRLTSTAADLGTPGWDPFFGSGLVNVGAASG